MIIEPYNKIDGVSLSIRDYEIFDYFGAPERKQTNSIGLAEFDFGSKVFRFDSSGELLEVTIESEVIELNKLSIPFEHLAGFLNSHDAGVFTKYGFIISPQIGVAFDPEYSPWVTVLTRKGLSAWQNV